MRFFLGYQIILKGCQKRQLYFDQVWPHMPSVSQHHKCKVASPTCFCKPTSLKSSAAGVTLTLTEPIWASIVFSKPVSNPGLDQAPCTVCIGHPNKIDGMRLFWNIHRYKISISWLLVFVLCKLCIMSKGKNSIFIGPESDHWQCLSVTDSLTDSLLFSKLDWCDPGVWRCILETCWGCYCCWC